MKITEINLSSSKSVIYCGVGAFEKYAKQLIGTNAFIVTDSNIYKIYAKLINETFVSTPVYVISAGEKSKNKKTLFNILQAMLEHNLDRDCCVVALGGGVVGDIAGFAASMFMRGVKLIQIPTTLLAQVDSSVGGKTAIDFYGVKNSVGAFYQPFAVIADSLFLKTLPVRELRCGLGEIVKYGALDKDIYNKLFENIKNFSDISFLQSIIFDCIAHKIEVVSADERDVNGVRKTLNAGHTTGHAFELFYGRKSHGEYVLIGMYYELLIAERRGICWGQYPENLKKLICAVVKKIPVYADINKAAILALHDKKNTEGLISIIVPVSEGRVEEVKLSFEEYVKELEYAAMEIQNSYEKS